MVVIAIMGFLFSVVLATLSGAQRDARDKRRIEDLRELHNALELYYTDHQGYPTELGDEANGPLSTNTNLRNLLAPYLQGFPVDPAGLGNPVFDYYYDGYHVCGTDQNTGHALFRAVIFARQMDKPENANFWGTINVTCGHNLDGEGRGDGVESYNIILGEGRE
jgi:type II secretory pathway pseudopilin PulG